MTLNEWLEGNKTYIEAVVFDRNGNEIGLIYGDDDPIYNANVISITPRYPNDSANIVLDIRR